MIIWSSSHRHARFDGARAGAVWQAWVVIVGALFLEQRQSVKKFIRIAIVIAGVVGLQLSGAA